MVFDRLFEARYFDASEYHCTNWQRSHPLDSSYRTSRISQPQTRIALAALNYGRFLINQKETRADLFQRVNDASERLVQGQKEFSVTHWSMKVAGTELPVWPGALKAPEQITNGKVYVATLQGAKTGTLSVNLKMAWGQE